MAPTIRRIYIVLFLGSLILGLWRTIGFSQEPAGLIQVAVLKDVREFTIAIRGRFDIADLTTNEILVHKKILRDSRVTAESNGFRIGNDFYECRRLKVLPQKDATLYINGRRLRGELDVIRSRDDLLIVVNVLDLEDYVKGVLYHEISHHWPLEAIKAQAVAARTYAVYQIKMMAGKDYDVTSDIYSQVYGGRSSERYRTNVAVDRTKGLVMVFGGKILPAYYHATCAGFTEDVHELWSEDLPPLRGVPCPFCKDSPHYYWKKNFRLKDIQDKLNEKGYELGLIKEILVLERNKSGRIKALVVATRDEKKARISGKDFRNIIGPNIIKSNNYDMIMKGYYMDVIGKGWGHGVGLCQWGANFMSRKGYKYDEILKYYYPGIEIVSGEIIP